MIGPVFLILAMFGLPLGLTGVMFSIVVLFFSSVSILSNLIFCFLYTFRKHLYKFFHQNIAKAATTPNPRPIYAVFASFNPFLRTLIHHWWYITKLHTFIQISNFKPIPTFFAFSKTSNTSFTFLPKNNKKYRKNMWLLFHIVKKERKIS